MASDQQRNTNDEYTPCERLEKHSTIADVTIDTTSMLCFSSLFCSQIVVPASYLQ